MIQLAPVRNRKLLEYLRDIVLMVVLKLSLAAFGESPLLMIRMISLS